MLVQGLLSVPVVLGARPMYLRHPVRSPSHLRHEAANEQVKDLLPYRGDVAIHEVASGSWDRLRHILVPPI